MNRKDQRNGRDPIQTQLTQCDSSLRYPLSVFEAFAKTAPDTKRSLEIAAMPLPKVRRSTSPTNCDKLAELIAVSAISPEGKRSEADFAVCCFAIRNGISNAEVWAQVEGVGKFAERGQDYFNRTWENAEFEVRAAKYDKLQRKIEPQISAIAVNDSSIAPTDCHVEGSQVSEFQSVADSKPTIHIDTANIPVGDTLQQVTDVLIGTGNCFLRTEQLVTIHDHQIFTILSTSELAGLLNQHVEFFFTKDEGGEYKPFPPAYGSTWLANHAERRRMPAIKMFTRNPVYTSDWRLVASGFDQASGIYYAGPGISARSGTEHWDTLLRDFCFREPADRTNYLGILLTAILMPHFIGSHPAVLFNGNQPGLGKSILAQILSILRDGVNAETVSFNPNDEEFEKRLGAAVRRGATTIIIDNAKTRGRDPRIESACLERSITDAILSFRLLGQSDTIRTENSLIFCITANTPDVSRDLVTRSAVVNLYHEGDPQRREFSLANPEGYAHRYRTELLGELIGIVERWKQAGQSTVKTHSRFNKQDWGDIVGGILHACGEPDFLANADEAAASLDESRREFAELVTVLADHPQGVWKAVELVEQCVKHQLLSAHLGDGSVRSKATKFGLIAGRYVQERFPLPSGATAVFQREADRNGTVFRVGIVSDCGTLDGSRNV